jgi:hypothetical protein
MRTTRHRAGYQEGAAVTEDLPLCHGHRDQSLSEPHPTIHVLLSAPDGTMSQPSDRDLYFRDTD